MLDKLVVEVVEEIVDETIAVLRPRRRGAPAKRLHPALALIGYASIGIFIGVMSLLVRRRGVLPEQLTLPSLFVVPVLTGIATVWLGLWLRMNGRRTTSLTTFWGGAGLALGIACARVAFGL